MTNSESPFNWQGKPSSFTKSHDFNGVNHRRSEQQTGLEKKELYTLSTATPKVASVYSRAKAKTK
jgi:hypothetical protein